VQLLLATALPHLAVHQEKRHLWVSAEDLGAVHKGSVNCSKAAYVYPSPIFAFLDQVKEGGWKPPRCRQLTNLPPLLALLRPFVSGEIRLDAEEGCYVILEDWIPLQVPVDSAQLLLGLRCRIEDALVECTEHIAEEGGAAFAAAGGFQDPDLKMLLQDLLKQSSLRFREDQTYSGGPAGTAGYSYGGKAGAVDFGGKAGTAAMGGKAAFSGKTAAAGGKWGKGKFPSGKSAGKKGYGKGKSHFG